jgi:hypothetical protein
MDKANDREHLVVLIVVRLVEHDSEVIEHDQEDLYHVSQVDSMSNIF